MCSAPSVAPAGLAHCPRPRYVGKSPFWNIYIYVYIYIFISLLSHSPKLLPMIFCCDGRHVLSTKKSMLSLKVRIGLFFPTSGNPPYFVQNRELIPDYVQNRELILAFSKTRIGVIWGSKSELFFGKIGVFLRHEFSRYTLKFNLNFQAVRLENST